MPLPLPDLDDMTYDELVEEAIQRIPALDEDWTDHNPSDPGITLVELFAWLTEMTLYRVNRIPEAHIRVFLELLNGGATLPADTKSAIRQVLTDLRTPYRAVTPADYEWLALHIWNRKQLFPQQVLRLHVLPDCNLADMRPAYRLKAAPSHMSLIVLASSTGFSLAESGAPSAPSAAMLQSLQAFFEERTLVTTRVHVLPVMYVDVRVRASLRPQSDSLFRDVKATAAGALRAYYNPLTGGDYASGYDFGRGVYLSEVYGVLERATGVASVEDVKLAFVDSSRDPAMNSETGLLLHPHELPRLTEFDFQEMRS